MKSKQLFKTFLLCIGFTLLPVPAHAAGQETFVLETVVRESVDYNESELILQGLPREAFLKTQIVDSSALVSRTLPDSTFASGQYTYSLLEKSHLNLKADLPRHDDVITIHGTRKYYASIDMLAENAPSKALDLLKNYNFTLKIDSEAEKTCSYNLKRRRITLQQVTPSIYRIIGSIYGKITRLPGTRIWKNACKEEMQTAQSASYESFFSTAFSLYCKNPTQLESDYPSTYAFFASEFKK